MADNPDTTQETAETTNSQDTGVNMGSEPSNMPLEAPESPKNADIPVSLNNDNPENSPVLTENPKEPKSEVLPAKEEKTEEMPEAEPRGHSYQRSITTAKQKWYNARDNDF